MRLQYFTNSKFDFIVKELKFQLNNKKEHPDVCGASMVPLTLNYLFVVKNVKYILQIAYGLLLQIGMAIDFLVMIINEFRWLAIQVIICDVKNARWSLISLMGDLRDGK